MAEHNQLPPGKYPHLSLNELGRRVANLDGPVARMMGRQALTQQLVAQRVSRPPIQQQTRSVARSR
ncbi:hypothetical protein KKE45_00750 [Patescibacteria group bacterium]|nr:hypothetical protein [Patescibacteria group bacterium]